MPCNKDENMMQSVDLLLQWRAYCELFGSPW
jgi:hypothetical protein